MLRVRVPAQEFYDDGSGEFYYVHETVLQMEHSLISISKWESKWKKPFLSTPTDEMTPEELIDYLKCMTITQNVDPNIYYAIPAEVVRDEIAVYINDPMTATTFSAQGRRRRRREVVTAEIIYYWMVSYNIPFECQKWHLNRLLTLINVLSIKNNPDKKKMSKSDIIARNRELNAERQAKLRTKG